MNHCAYPRAKAFELVDSGLVDVDTMLSACLAYLSEDDVNDMLHANEFDEIMEEVG